MKLNNRLPIAFFLFTTFALLNTSCVGKKRFEREVASRDSVVMSLNGRVLDLNGQIARLDLQLAEKIGANKALTDLQIRQETQIKDLEADIRSLKAQSSAQKDNLNKEIEKRAQEVAAKEKVISDLQASLDKKEADLQALQVELQTALAGFDQGRIAVLFKEGRVHVALDEKLMFKPGSDQMAKGASDILAKVAEVLNKHPEVEAVVTGHTDNQPVKSKSYTDNWELSAVQAAAVVRVLTKDYYINPNQVVAAGKADSQPRATNETAEGREKNRRVEVVVAPQLDEILKLVQQNIGQ